MALPADYISGTITLTNGSPNFTGTGTGWQAADFREGDILLGVEDHAGQVYVIATITSQTSGTLTQEWAGTSGTYTYRMRYEWDSSRVSAQARAMVELLGNGNLEALAGLTGPGVPVFNGPHAMIVKPETDFINGVTYDVQVDTLADRAAYDGQAAGFAVLVSDMGDGRSALFSKASNTSGDWTDAAYITGPVGPEFEVTVGPTTTLPPDQQASVTPVGIPGGVRLDFAIPRGPTGDITGVTPFWNTRLGSDTTAAAARAGLGAGDFVGPNGGVADGQLVAFDGNTGKAGKLATMPAATVKGRASGAGTGAVSDVSALHLGIFTPPGFATADLTPSGVFTLIGNTFGFYRFASQTGDNIQVPPGFPQTNGVIEGYLNSNNTYGYTWQKFTGHSSNRIWMRRAINATTWGPWQEIYHQGSILGTVSQSSGVPTGAIIERGSNANGSYIKWADGTQICMNEVTDPITTSNAQGGIYHGGSGISMTFPSAFAAIPSVSRYSHRNGVPGGLGISWAADVAASGDTTATTLRATVLSGLSTSVASVGYIAIGRWF